MNQLERIVASTRRELERRRQAIPAAELERAAVARGGRHPVRSFAAAIARPGLAVIAEHKRRSPSAGPIREDLTLTEVVQAYERGGASALSVLTDGPSFGGSLDDLTAARIACALPILRKDFIVDPYQVVESYVHGADAILLIVAALARRQLADLHDRAQDLGLNALVEVHDEHELEVALSLSPRVVGINNRDLTTLEVDVARTYALAPLIAGGTLVVAESGFRRRSELEELLDAGIDGVLVGEALMRAPQIEAACRDLAAAGS